MKLLKAASFCVPLPVVILAFVFVLGVPKAHAASQQIEFRFRNDNGGESSSGATWMAVQNTNVTNIAKSTNFRIRLMTQKTSPGTYIPAVQLEYLLASGNTCTSAGWTKITTSTGNAFALALSSNFADKDPTTQQLTGGSGSFVAGEMLQATNPADSVNLTNSVYTEHEFNIQATANALNSTAYLFRLSNNGASYNTYSVCPQLTTAAAAPAASGVMSSTHYQLQSDSLNFGGVRSASGSYTLEDTLGEVATGMSSSTNYSLSAGYQQMQNVSISVTPAASVVLSPSFGGIVGGTANGSTNFTVTTDDPAGYSATIQASSSPALKSGIYYFPDYKPAGASPDFTFTFLISTSTFAFSPKGTDIASRYLDDGSSNCGTGSSQTAGACWDGLSTAPMTILSRTSPNTPSGTMTTLNFRAASGSQNVQADGVYTATTTITVMAL